MNVVYSGYTITATSYDLAGTLFSPAKVTVTSLKTGESFQSGKIDDAVLQRSFA